MTFGATVDLVPDLSPGEHAIPERSDENFVKWSDPEEFMFDMEGINPHWNILGKNPVEFSGEREITLLDRLLRKWLCSSTVVTEEIGIPYSPSKSESCMDSTVNPSQSKVIMLVIPTSSSKVTKME